MVYALVFGTADIILGIVIPQILGIPNIPAGVWSATIWTVANCLEFKYEMLTGADDEVKNDGL